MKRVKARKNKSLDPSILESMTMPVTLSDRLRQAGIRECEPDCKSGKSNQNRKNQPQKGQAEKSNRNKKLRNLSKELHSPHFIGYHQNKTTSGKIPSKTHAHFSKSLSRKIRGSVKKTIFASLDFIKDCQKYKKKVRNPEKHSEIKFERKSEGKKEGKNESVSSNHKQNHDANQEPLKLHYTKTYSQISFQDGVKRKKEALILDVRENKETENSCATKDNSLLDQNTEKVNLKEESNDNERKSQSNKEVYGTSTHVKPFFDEFPSGDVVRIDKKYLQSLLSLAKDKTCTDSVETKNNQEAAREKNRKVKKKSNEASQGNKLRIKKSGETKGEVEELQKDSKSIKIPSHKFSEPAKTVRDSTKSEAQILVQKKKFRSQRNSEMKSEKNMAYKKPEVHDIRKNRKNRNTSLKSKNKEFPDSVLPNETPKIIDVTELWRRDIREKSENSLSSNSSCTVPKSDADLEQKNLGLESYKVLKKFVEEEVKKMSNESEKKNNLKEVEGLEYNVKTKHFKSVNMKNLENVENICKKLRISMAENTNDEVEMIENKISSLKKKLMQDEHPQRYSIYEGERLNPMLLNTLAQDKFKDQKINKKLLKEKGKSREKTQSKINNWSILNRLEQAFLALGTPNFQDKDIKNSTPLKGEELISNKKTNANASRKDHNHLEKINKKPQKSKEVEEKKGERDASNSTNSTPKTKIRNKRPENDEKRNLINNNQPGTKFKKESENDGQQNNTLVKIAKDKKIDAIQEKKKMPIQTTHENSKKKPTAKTHTKPKENVCESKESGRNQNKKSFLIDNEQAQKHESCHKKLFQEKDNAKENLEKTKTFDIIQKKDPKLGLSGESRESENSDETSHDFEMDNVNVCHSQMKNTALKKDYFSHKNTTDTPQSRGENMTNEAETTIKSFIPVKSIKAPIKINPKNQEERKTAEENLEIFRKNTEAKKNLEIFRKRAEVKDNLETFRKIAEAKKNLEMFRRNAEAKANLETSRKISEAKENLEMFRKNAEAKANLEISRKIAEAKENLEMFRRNAEAKANLGTFRKIGEAKENLETSRKRAEVKDNLETFRKIAEKKEILEISRKNDEAKDNLETFRKIAEAKKNLEMFRKNAEAKANLEISRKIAEAKENLETSRKIAEAKDNLEIPRKISEKKEILETSRKRAEVKDNLETFRKIAEKKEILEISRKNDEAKDNLETFRKTAEAKENLEMFRRNAEAKANLGTFPKIGEAKENLETSRKRAEAKENLEIPRKIAEKKEILEISQKNDEAKDNLETFRKSAEAKENLEVLQKNAEEKETLEIPQKITEENENLETSRKSTETMENLDIPQKSYEKIRETNTEQEIPRENVKEISKFPTHVQEKKLLNNSSERVIKERSILSISKSQQGPKESTRKLMQIETSEIFSALQLSSSENSETEKSQNDLSDFLEPSAEPLRQTNCSTTSSTNISNFKPSDPNSVKNPKQMNINDQENSLLILSNKLNLSSDLSYSNLNSVKQSSEIEMKETKLNVPRGQTKMLWEQDIHHYRAVVKEIMNHYNRIKGFLTHNDHFQSLSNDSAELLSTKDSSEQGSTSDKPMQMNLREYRKKIMWEYQALPIFEYKRQLQEKKEENLLTKEATKRNLSVVKDVTTEMDLDVKDYEPQIQKVLDSQLYVDLKNLCKRNHLNSKEKKSSLQEIVLNKKKKMDNQERLRTSSTLKTFPPLCSSSVSVESSRKLKTNDSFQEDSTETVTSTSMEETESENPEQISQSGF